MTKNERIIQKLKTQTGDLLWQVTTQQDTIEDLTIQVNTLTNRLKELLPEEFKEDEPVTK